MNKSDVMIAVSAQIKTINKLKKDLAWTRWKLAHELSIIKDQFVWADTEYKTFFNFLKEELPNFSTGSIYKYVNTYQKARKLGYSLPDLKKISAEVSFSKAAIYIAAINQKVPVNQFIIEAQAYRLKSVEKITNPNRFTFELSNKATAILEALLEPYGYSRNNRTKSNVSLAMMRYLDQL